MEKTTDLATPSTPILLSTDGVPPSQALEYWNDISRKTVGNYQVLKKSKNFQCSLSVRKTNELLISELNASPMALIRRAREVDTSPRDEYSANIVIDGVGVIGQDKDRRVLRKGDIVVLNGMFPLRMLMTSGWHSKAVNVPAHLLEQAIKEHRTKKAFVLRQGEILGDLAAACMRLLNQPGALAWEVEFATKGLVDIFACAVAPGRMTCDAIEELPQSAMFARACTLVREQLDLTTRQMRKTTTASLGVSEDVLERLFDSRGEKFDTFVLSHRLMECFRILENDWERKWTIEALSVAVGFHDASHLSSSFKFATGLSVDDWRARALEGR